MDPITPIDLEIQRSEKEKHAGGRPLGPRGEIPILEEHLASHCSNVPQLILREYMEKVRSRENTSNKKRKIDKSVVGQTTITAFHNSTNLPEARINRINRALVKFFVCCEIAYRIVEHPFFIDLLKELNAGYDPPTWEYLSGRLLETELCNVNEKMNEDIMNQHNLTLGGKLRKLIEESGIKGGGLKSYCVTRWTTSSESVNSVLNLKPVLEKPVRRTINGEIIPDDNVIVLIENVWIENEIDLSNDIILKGIGNIPKDLDDDFIDNEKNNNENIVLTDDETVDDTNGRGILNYNVNDLLDECINEN
ncbi:14859_t:CDS:2 [Rhizophagus irregularis]|nr:14859_t:CDS:2 [Rhizophagus irregularis]